VVSVQLLVAVALIWLPAWSWLRLLVPRDTPGYPFILSGYSLLGGLLMLPLLMRGVNLLGVPLSVYSVGATAAVVALAGLLLRVIRPQPAVAAPPPAQPLYGPLPRLLLLLLLGLIAGRIVLLGVELCWRPLFPWDASMHWATKTKVWLALGEIAPFVEQDRWLALGGDGVYTDHHPLYPVTIPLLQVWMGLVLGGYDPSLINLPWLVMFIGLGLAFYGQAIAAGVRPLVATVATYMLLSMPLLNTHVALAGYADLLLGACYAAAIMAFHGACAVPRYRRWAAPLAGVFALGCVLVKNEGLFWMLTLVPAILAVMLPKRVAIPVLAGGGLLVLLVLWLFPRDVAVAGHTLAELDLRLRPQALWPIVSSFLRFDSWHLAGWLMLLLVPAGLLCSGAARRNYVGVGTALGAALLLFLTLFLFTEYDTGAIRQSAVSRISLHLVPALLFFALLQFRELSDPTGSAGCHEQQAHTGQLRRGQVR
jgi:hypothetical protein